MAKINDNFQKLPGSYLFTETAHRVRQWRQKNPGERLISMGIGDVTLPLPHAVVNAMEKAAEEMGTPKGFRGYGPEQGYEFLRDAIAEHDYHARGIQISPEEIFISDGAKSDCGGILTLFHRDNVIALCDPVYPAYADGAAIAGRAGEYDYEKNCWSGLCYLPCTEDNGFVPLPPKERADLVYLCFPNNPTGITATRQQLKAWVNWANGCGAVLLYDGAYEAFVADPELPRSIYEIEGAKTCAIELRSFSKTAGFTGVRCGYTVIPKALERDGCSLHKLWARRLAARFNGVSYVVQRGAQALYGPEGRLQVTERIAYYRRNAAVIRGELAKTGVILFGGENSPYIWLKVPEGMDSWSFFDLLLYECAMVTTPGAGFGPHGEGYLRLTAFGNFGDTLEAMERIKNVLS